MEILKTLILTLYMGRGLWLNAACQCLDFNINITKPPPTEMLQYFAAGESQQLVIIPEMYFKCHGNITSWSALTVVKQHSFFLEILTHQLTFTVWRPREDNKYELVGENLLAYEGDELRSGITQIDNSSGLIPSNIGYFRFSMKKPAEQITFQPGDVVGWNVHRTIKTIHSQLSVVYRKANSQDTGAVNLLSLETDTKKTYCSVLRCDNTQSIASVIPYFSIQYDIEPNASSTQSRPTCFNREQLQCPDIPTTSATSTLDDALLCPGWKSCPTAGRRSALTYYIAAGGAAIVLLLLVILVVVVVICVCMSKGILKEETQQENPIYESAVEEDSRFEYHESSPPNSKNYSCVTPDVILYSKTSIAADIDGDCYASTYETNGQIHFYQELSETNPRARTMSTAMSYEVINQRLDLPLRMAKSSDSLSRCRLTVPNLPTPAYTEIVKNASKKNALGYSCPDIRKNVMSLPQTPEITISERKNFQEDIDSMYSKLKYVQEAPKNPDSVHAVSMDNGDAYYLSSTELYDELWQGSCSEIQRQHVSTTEFIGGGYFHKVYTGNLKIPRGELKVVVKTLNPESPCDDRAKFVKEAAILGQCAHANVVKLLGIVATGEPLMFVLELMHGGDLDHYLRTQSDLSAPISKHLPITLLGFCRQVGMGMNYLSSKGIVHRNLVARNIFVTEDLTCKIGDFGMAQYLEEDIIDFSQGEKGLPKWPAPEQAHVLYGGRPPFWCRVCKVLLCNCYGGCIILYERADSKNNINNKSLKYNQFSSASDVWSYGMLLFEIWSLGKNPFEGMLSERVMELVHTGYCQPPPPGCPRAIYQLMVQCWHNVPKKRITFSNICSYLSSFKDEILLLWTRSDLNTLPQAAELGAPLMEARTLYLDLQYTYSSISCV